MALYFDGYTQSRKQVEQMSGEQLLRLLDDLQGRDNLPDHCTGEELMQEALRQHREEWTDKDSPEYDQVQFWTKVVRAQLS